MPAAIPSPFSGFPDTPPPPAAPSTPLVRRVALAAGDIKLAHSVFALPFALLGAVLARDPSRPAARFAGQLALVVVCMVLARTWAMLVNRLADATLDAANPRTARRAVASGSLARRDAARFAGVCGVGFVLAAGGFWVFFDNIWPIVLSVPVLGWLALYSFAKRFTSLCHVLLGSSLAISPLAAALAINPPSLASTPALWWLAGMVVYWVAGFDVIYALQDTDFDRQKGLFSIPSRLGPRRAIWLSRVLHAAALASLVMAARSEPRFGPIFGAAVALAAGMLVVEHIVLQRRGLAGLPMAFFTCNGVISCVIGALGIIDTLV